jgi:succinyl-CoA synthetase alpha subunit
VAHKLGILINKNTRAIVQGITGKQGSYHTQQMQAYDTKILAGVVPGKGGITVKGVPVYDTVKETVEAHGCGYGSHRQQHQNNHSHN